MKKPSPFDVVVNELSNHISNMSVDEIERTMDDLLKDLFVQASQTLDESKIGKLRVFAELIVHFGTYLIAFDDINSSKTQDVSVN